MAHTKVNIEGGNCATNPLPACITCSSDLWFEGSELLEICALRLRFNLCACCTLGFRVRTCVRRSSFSSLRATSRRRSQLGFFGATLNSTSCGTGYRTGLKASVSRALGKALYRETLEEVGECFGATLDCTSWGAGLSTGHNAPASRVLGRALR